MLHVGAPRGATSSVTFARAAWASPAARSDPFLHGPVSVAPPKPCALHSTALSCLFAAVFGDKLTARGARGWLTAGTSVVAAPLVAASFLIPDPRQSFWVLLVGYALRWVCAGCAQISSTRGPVPRRKARRWSLGPARLAVGKPALRCRCTALLVMVRHRVPGPRASHAPAHPPIRRHPTCSECWRSPVAVMVREVSPPGLGSTASAVHLGVRGLAGALGPLGIAWLSSKVRCAVLRCARRVMLVVLPCVTC